MGNIFNGAGYTVNRVGALNYAPYSGGRPGGGFVGNYGGGLFGMVNGVFGNNNNTGIGKVINAVAQVGNLGHATNYGVNSWTNVAGNVVGIVDRVRGHKHQSEMYNHGTGAGAWDARTAEDMARDRNTAYRNGGQTPPFVPEGRGANNNGPVQNGPAFSLNDIRQYEALNKVRNERAEADKELKELQDKAIDADGKSGSDISKSEQRKIDRAAARLREAEADEKVAEARTNPAILQREIDNAARQVENEKRYQDAKANAVPTANFQNYIKDLNEATTPEAKQTAAAKAMDSISKLSKDNFGNVQLSFENLDPRIQEYIRSTAPRNNPNFVHPLLQLNTPENLADAMSAAYAAIGQGRKVDVDVTNDGKVTVKEGQSTTQKTNTPAGKGNGTQGAGAANTQAAPESVTTTFNNAMIAANEAKTPEERKAALQKAASALELLKLNQDGAKFELDKLDPALQGEVIVAGMTKKTEMQRQNPGKDITNEEVAAELAKDSEALMAKISASLAKNGHPVNATGGADIAADIKEAVKYGKEHPMAVPSAAKKMNEVDVAPAPKAEDIKIQYKRTGTKEMAEVQIALEKLGYATDKDGVDDHKVDGVFARYSKAAADKAIDDLKAAGLLPKDLKKGDYSIENLTKLKEVLSTPEAIEALGKKGTGEIPAQPQPAVASEPAAPAAPAVSVDPKIKELQTKLAAAGYDVQPTGVWNDNSKAAMTEFVRANTVPGATERKTLPGHEPEPGVMYFRDPRLPQEVTVAKNIDFTNPNDPALNAGIKYLENEPITNIKGPSLMYQIEHGSVQKGTEGAAEKAPLGSKGPITPLPDVEEVTKLTSRDQQVDIGLTEVLLENVGRLSGINEQYEKGTYDAKKAEEAVDRNLYYTRGDIKDVFVNDGKLTANELLVNLNSNNPILHGMDAKQLAMMDEALKVHGIVKNADGKYGLESEKPPVVQADKETAAVVAQSDKEAAAVTSQEDQQTKDQKMFDSIEARHKAEAAKVNAEFLKNDSVPDSEVTASTTKDKAVSNTLLEALATQLPVAEWAKEQSKQEADPSKKMNKLIEQGASGNVKTNQNQVLEVGELVDALNSKAQDFTPKNANDKDFAKLLADNGITRAADGAYKVLETKEANSQSVGDASKKTEIGVNG